jgi:hypothetical protein
MEYIVVRYSSQFTKHGWPEDFHETLNHFETQVSAKLREGYIPCGGVSIEKYTVDEWTAYRCIQALTKKKTTKSKKTTPAA